MTSPNIENAQAVMSLKASATIDAPIEKVWEILLDFEKYPEWNSFVRSQMVIDPQTGKPLPNQSPAEGQTLLLSCHIPPTMDVHAKKQASREIITEVDSVNHRVSWRYSSMPQALLLRGARWQALSVVHEGGKTVTKYESQEDFGGPLAYFVKWFVRADLQKSFIVMASELKTRAEQK